MNYFYFRIKYNRKHQNEIMEVREAKRKVIYYHFSLNILCLIQLCCYITIKHPSAVSAHSAASSSVFVLLRTGIATSFNHLKYTSSLPHSFLRCEQKCCRLKMVKKVCRNLHPQKSTSFHSQMLC